MKGTALIAALMAAPTAEDQITTPRVLSSEIDRYATLNEQLTNRLHATRDDQQAYIQYVVKLVEVGKIDVKLVVAIERYALRRNSHYAFPFFERALRYESAKRGVLLPKIQHFASTKSTTRR